jgi:hypothetical protein
MSLAPCVRFIIYFLHHYITHERRGPFLLSKLKDPSPKWAQLDFLFYVSLKYVRACLHNAFDLYLLSKYTASYPKKMAMVNIRIPFQRK